MPRKDRGAISLIGYGRRDFLDAMGKGEDKGKGKGEDKGKGKGGRGSGGC